MTSAGSADHLAVLTAASRQAGLDAAGAAVIRVSENAIFRLRGSVVARVGRPGPEAPARKEVAVARWLAEQGVPAVRPVDGIDQPVRADGRSVTFWEELPPHRRAGAGELAAALRSFHDLPFPDVLDVGPLTPFVRIAERIDTATTLEESERQWLRRRLAELERRYEHDLPAGQAHRLAHGDPWSGNVVVPEAGGPPVFLDLERAGIGPPEWDLIATTMGHTHFGLVSDAGYADFCDRYGFDVKAWEGFGLLRDIRELRVTTALVQRASERPDARREAGHRLACIQGKKGERPWDWVPVL